MMENPTLTAMTIACAALCAVACAAFSQDHTRHERGMRHGGTTLFLAQMSGTKVVPPRPVAATATGAFLVDPEKRIVSYDLTYHGLEQGPPKSIALHNFGEGGNGALVHVICGDAVRPCPDLTSANLIGMWDGRGQTQLDTKLLGEFASARVYAEIVGGDGKPEIRGQLEPNDAMVPVRNFVVHLDPAPGSEGRGVGTAVLSEVHFRDRVAVFYAVTVVGTTSEPTNAALVQEGATPRFNARNALPELKILPSRVPASGGTMTGQYEVRRTEADGLLATRMLQEGSGAAGIVVSTRRFPEGELFGALRPVQ
jgi:hypothetical protein